MEIYKSVIGYEGIYEVSNKGEIRSLESRWGKPCQLKQSTDKGGYKIVTLCKEKKHLTKTVHRVVATAFLGLSWFDVNHKDGNKSNNHVENLEFVSKSQNTRHAIANGLFIPNTDKIAKEKRKKVIQINPFNNRTVNTFISAHDASKKTGYNRGNLSTACRLGTLANGYKWKYIE